MVGEDHISPKVFIDVMDDTPNQLRPPYSYTYTKFPRPIFPVGKYWLICVVVRGLFGPAQSMATAPVLGKAPSTKILPTLVVVKSCQNRPVSPHCSTRRAL